MSSTPLIALGAFLVLGLGALALSRKKVDEV
jgi:LPXTG-motif cell wall-anchored protein